jgi:hypothetical protein
MAQETSFTSSGEQLAGAIDLDEIGSQLRSHPSMRSVATREDFLSDDSVPLFLSGPAEAPKPPAFGKTRDGAVIWRRPIKTGILVIAAAAAGFAVLSVKNPFPVVANATASLIGISSVPSVPAPSAPTTQSTASIQALSPATREAPTRDEIALALRAAHQSQAPAEIRLPVIAAPPVTAAPPARRLGADELAALMTRAKGLLAAGDIPSARLLLERAADAQEPSATLMLAQTYDTAVLGTQDTRNINTDPALARSWYQRAVQLGSTDAQRRLSQMP